MPTAAGEIHVVSVEAARDVLEPAAKDFSQKTGYAVSFSYVTAGQVRDKVAAGEPVDLAITSRAMIAELVKSGKAASSTDLVRSGMAVAIRDGAMAPDLSTPDAFVKALLAARSVAYTNPAAGGTAGVYFAGLLQRFGIADSVNKTAVLATSGRDVAARVASGEAEFGITFPSEINPVKGARVGGMLPAAVQNYVTYSAAIPVASKNAENARAFRDMLAAPAVHDLWRKAGFEEP